LFCVFHPIIGVQHFLIGHNLNFVKYLKAFIVIKFALKVGKMVVRKRKKVRKLRGSKTHGYGSKKKHRGKGSKGGKGMAGLKKHKKSWMLKYEPDHFGKVGFKQSMAWILKKKREREKVITLRELDILAEKLNTTEINLEELGYRKVISSGTISKPLVIRVEKITEKAKEKIEAIGGKVETL
jgi:large subunit ribosomal protein L15